MERRHRPEKVWPFALAIVLCLVASLDVTARIGHLALQQVYYQLSGVVLDTEADYHPGVATLQKLVHVFVFALLGIFSATGRSRTRTKRLLAGLVLCVAAEWMQTWTRTRTAAFWDIWLNISSFLMAFAAVRTIRNQPAAPVFRNGESVVTMPGGEPGISVENDFSGWHRGGQLDREFKTGTNWKDGIRRVVDVALSSFGLLIAFPAMALAALAVYWEDGAPVLFRQVRIGRRGRKFEILKFRSMRVAQSGTAVTAGGDARITRTGQFLRKYKLDELPQLWNVLVGDMGLIGPRPEVPKFVDLSNPLWRKVLSVRPGITDLASLYYRHEEGLLAGAVDPEAEYRNLILPSKLAIAAQGVERRSLRNDLRILTYTVLCSFFPRRFDGAALMKGLASRSTL